jgi:4-amino-4-deoxy-L-arabinose transferase-like glycosyltransferase
MDSVHFALALKNYDIAVHQPHPPGYFLYIMLGRFFSLFTSNANMTFIMISVLFSGLTVVAVYLLGRELYDKKTGLLAAIIALTSPNIWFHGEVALTYIVESFFSTAFALVCWKVYKGNHRYLWLSAVILAVAGGVRQNTAVFLFPLWLFSMKGVPLRKIMLSMGLFSMCCLFWFFPMVRMTGGWDVYKGAFREIWLFNTLQLMFSYEDTECNILMPERCCFFPSG